MVIAVRSHRDCQYPTQCQPGPGAALSNAGGSRSGSQCRGARGRTLRTAGMLLAVTVRAPAPSRARRLRSRHCHGHGDRRGNRMVSGNRDNKEILSFHVRTNTADGHGDEIPPTVTVTSLSPGPVGLWRRPRGGRVAAPPVSESLAGCHCRGPVTGTVNVTSLARAADSLSGSVTVRSVPGALAPAKGAWGRQPGPQACRPGRRG
jgi:hypothetical protein